MRGKRTFFFLIMIVVGLALGLLYGWVINPLENEDSSPARLRADYKADYVLMVAEIYHADQKLDEAIERLGLISSLAPERIVAEALLTGQQIGYAAEDLAIMEDLSLALQKNASSSGGQP